MTRDLRSFWFAFALTISASISITGIRASAADSPELKLKQGDHIALIGNTLADRMQHDGWLETLLQNRFPHQQLVIRDLGYSGDELTVRLRSANFGSPDDWLSFTKADVVFAFFGYNESFGGTAGLSKFKRDLDNFIKHTLTQKYSGKGTPRLVLFSPIAQENLHDRNLPDGTDNNQRIELYTAAMAEVAKANRVLFVDLFQPTRALYAKASKPLTINGVHLTEEGNRLVAQVIEKALFPNGPEPQLNAKALAKLRGAILEKNFCWFNRYRTVDGYNVYGGRADLRFVNGQTNRVVLQREMAVLDVMTANRDRRVWAVAQGGDLKVDDSNAPPFIPVITNKPGPGPNGSYFFLDGEEAIQRMTVAKGMKVNLFASEKEFPELAKPVQMSFDTKGRLWVAVWPSYPHWKPRDEMNDKILIFEDTKGTGKADKLTVFADHLHCPTGFEFWGGGVLVAQAPGLLFLKDTDGDDKADVSVRILDGIDSADTHHTENSFQLDAGGALYFQEGTFHHSQVETPYGPPVRCANAGVFRYEPRTQKFDVYVTFGFANPHGHVFNRWGQDIVMDGTGANPYDGALFSGHLDFPQKHARPPQVYQQRTRPCPGIEILSSRHFPEQNQGNLLVPNVIGFQGILQYKIEDKGSSLAGTEMEPILYSSDPNFRPSDIKMGPDGAIYFLDWQNPIIGHMQHNLRDPSRDQTHGRIYRVTYESRPLLKPAKIAGASINELLNLLKEPEDRVRYRARIELSGRDSDQVIAALQEWVARLDKTDPQYEHNLMEALWLHQSHNRLNRELLKRMLGSPEFHARAAATRVLCYWRDRIPDALDLLKNLAADPARRVRLEAVRAASFFTVPEAIEVALVSAEHPTDQYLDFILGETRKALEPHVKKAIAQGRKIAFTTAAGARYFLHSVSTDELVKMDRSRPVCLELLFRRGVRDEFRKEALAGLSKLENKSEVAELLDAIRSQESGTRGQAAADESVVFDLVRLLTSRPVGELAAVRPELEQMATSARLPVIRQLGFVALIAADGDVEKAWALGMKNPAAMQDLLHAMPLLGDPGLRARLYPKVELLLQARKELTQGQQANVKKGRYVRIELPWKRKTLTLAEVEVYSDGRNIAGQGKATQKNTAYGGDATRAIDGNVSGDFSDGGQSHTRENTPKPWWEVDLGSEYPIDSIVIYNRTDDGLGKRLNGFTLQVLNQARKVVFERRQLPAPERKGTYEVGGEIPERALRHAAFFALTSVRGREEETFKTLARLIRAGSDRDAAIQALERIPPHYWPKDEVQPLLDSIVSYVRSVPASERTGSEVRNAIQLGDGLAAMLPLEIAKRVRKELGALDVPIIRLSTVPDQMLYDKERLAVQAGKPVEFVFENSDLMPHNFVIAQPGSLEEIGTLAESTATDPQAADRDYVPPSKKILLASRLLQPRATQRLSFTAPKQPGIYPYVCTYPGHWRRMYGALYVVEDLEQYQEDAGSYLARHPLPILDELLKYTGPRKEWKFEELAASAQQLDHGRSFSNGKQMFQVATCIACHKMDGVGTEIGPDLTKLDPKQQQPVEVLHDILEPSFRINEKYQTYIFELKSGKTLTGLILQETPEEVKVIENPLVKAQPVVLKKSEIEDRLKSPTSIMPKGLLDKLTREEILDLVAYIASRGDPHHKFFQGEHQHGTHSGH